MIVQVSEGVTCPKARRDPEESLYPAKQRPKAGRIHTVSRVEDQMTHILLLFEVV